MRDFFFTHLPKNKNKNKKRNYLFFYLFCKTKNRLEHWRADVEKLLEPFNVLCNFNYSQVICQHSQDVLSDRQTTSSLNKFHIDARVLYQVGQSRFRHQHDNHKEPYLFIKLSSNNFSNNHIIHNHSCNCKPANLKKKRLSKN